VQFRTDFEESSMITIRQFASAITIAAATLLSPTASAWGWGTTVTGSGTAKTDTRNVSGFTGVGISVPAKVTIVQGDKEGVTLEGDDNIVAIIETEVERGGLKLRFAERGTNVKTKLPLKATIHVKTLESLSVAGSGDVIADQLKCKNLKTSIAGSGDVDIKNLSADQLKVSIAGSGDMAIGSGKVNAIEVSIAGSGDIKAGGVEADKVKVSIAGSGDATVWAKANLSVSVAGSGDVKYYGNPEVKKSVMGSGSTKKLGDTPPAN
jgi:hypothetical protein